MNVMEHRSYRSFLKNMLAQHEQANPSYSLRAFARKLDIAPSHLSSILNGKKNLSPERALAVTTRLALSEKEREYFCLSVQAESTSDFRLKESYIERARKLNPATAVHDLSLDYFKTISEWFHFAILAATELSGFAAKPENFSRALGITKIDAELALERLERLGMAERDSKGCYRKKMGNPRVESAAPNEALRSFHRQTLTKAIESLETQTPKEKVVGSETFAIDDSQLEEFRALADRFFDEALLIAKKAKKKNRVYHLGVQFFNLTQNMKGKQT